MSYDRHFDKEIIVQKRRLIKVSVRTLPQMNFAISMIAPMHQTTKQIMINKIERKKSRTAIQGFIDGIALQHTAAMKLGRPVGLSFIFVCAGVDGRNGSRKIYPRRLKATAHRIESEQN